MASAQWGVCKAARDYITKMISDTPGMKVMLLDEKTVSRRARRSTIFRRKRRCGRVGGGVLRQGSAALLHPPGHGSGGVGGPGILTPPGHPLWASYLALAAHRGRRRPW